MTTGLGRACVLRVIKAWQVKHGEARIVREARNCGPIGFGPQSIGELWLRKCIGWFAKHMYSENRKLIRSEREYGKSYVVNGKWRELKSRYAHIKTCRSCFLTYF